MKTFSNNNLHLIMAGSIGCQLIPFVSRAQNPTQPEEKEEPVNIVFIMTDDHTAQMLSAYDKRHIETPNLDRIANDGIRFTESYVANSLSGPSRACLLTGKHSHKNGFTDNENSYFDNTQPTFPKYLQKAGYETAVIGKWHLESLPTGFDYWEVVPGQGQYYQPDFITMGGDTITRRGYLTNIITDMSLDWLENQRNKERPFCLMIHHKAIHRNWMADTCHLDLYEDKVFDLPENFHDNYEGRKAAASAEMRISDHMDLIYDLKADRDDKDSYYKGAYKWIFSRLDSAEQNRWNQTYQPIIEDFYSRELSDDELNEWKYQRYMRDYAKVVKSLDENVGRVLDYLEENDMLKNTLVVYTSDQGFYMGEHGWFDKRFMYEESFRTPLLMRLPEGYDRKGDVTEMVQNIDLAPTFLDIAGVEIPEDMQGESLLPLLKGESPQDWRTELYYHFYEYPAEHSVKRHYGVRDNRYKLIHFYNDIDEWELYDLQEDPYEMNNIYGPETEEIISVMKQKLKEQQIKYDDPILLEYPL